MRILLAMQLGSQALAIQSALKAGGFDEIISIETATGLLKAIETHSPAHEPLFATLLIDADLPDADPIETCAQVRLNPLYRDVPILIFTKPGNIDFLTQAFVAGVSDYLFKPFYDVELQARLRAIHRHLTQVERRRAMELELQRFRRPRSIWKSTEGASLDSETGLLGRQILIDSLEWHGRQNDEQGLTVLVALVDQLTSYRHLNGPKATQAMLTRIAACMGGAKARLDDLLAAYEPGCFAIVTRMARAEAYLWAQTLTQSIAELMIPHHESAWREHVSVSIGIASSLRRGPDLIAQLLPSAIRAAEQAAAEGGAMVVQVADLPSTEIKA
ncbi:MAG: response regulator [Alphaproteobacteria bacterium]|nr:response regulator [Alphaproteobacteria bacterium]